MHTSVLHTISRSVHTRQQYILRERGSCLKTTKTQMDLCSCDVCVQRACWDRAVFYKLSYLKTFREYMITHKPTDTKPPEIRFLKDLKGSDSGEAVRQKKKKKRKTSKKLTAMCVPFLSSFLVVSCLYCYKQTEQEGNCKYNNTITFYVSAFY